MNPDSPLSNENSRVGDLTFVRALALNASGTLALQSQRAPVKEAIIFIRASTAGGTDGGGAAEIYRYLTEKHSFSANRAA